VNPHVFQLNTSPGGVPKLPIPEAAVAVDGMSGDRQRDLRHHGGPERALCLYSLEKIAELQGEGHPIHPGSTGENVTIAGIPWEDIRPGVQLELGEALVEVTSFTPPCRNIAGSFMEEGFTRISQKLHPGDSRVYARVMRGGTLRAGDPVRIVDNPSGQMPASPGSMRQTVSARGSATDSAGDG
jgi:MOSC domain-containing protein YiiM